MLTVFRLFVGLLSRRRFFSSALARILFMDSDLVAFGREWILDVLAKCDREDVGGAIGGEIELRLRKLRMEFVIGHEIEVIAFWIPGRGGLVEAPSVTRRSLASLTLQI